MLSDKMSKQLKEGVKWDTYWILGKFYTHALFGFSHGETDASLINLNKGGK